MKFQVYFSIIDGDTKENIEDATFTFDSDNKWECESGWINMMSEYNADEAQLTSVKIIGSRFSQDYDYTQIIDEPVFAKNFERVYEEAKYTNELFEKIVRNFWDALEKEHFE